MVGPRAARIGARVAPRRVVAARRLVGHGRRRVAEPEQLVFQGIAHRSAECVTRVGVVIDACPRQ
jgi:hypothetical protein